MITYLWQKRDVRPILCRPESVGNVKFPSFWHFFGSSAKDNIIVVTQIDEKFLYLQTFGKNVMPY
jgi:hypothetical protein